MSRRVPEAHPELKFRVIVAWRGRERNVIQAFAFPSKKAADGFITEMWKRSKGNDILISKDYPKSSSSLRSKRD